MSVERTLIVIKPDAVKRGLIGEILARFERKGFKIVRLKMLKMSRECAERFYDVHRGKHFFEPLVEFMTSTPVVAAVLEGPNAIEVVRLMIGPTDGRKAPPGTIRGDYALDIQENTIHASDSSERAAFEESVIFDPGCPESE